jgi:hypothetical protein
METKNMMLVLENETLERSISAIQQLNQHLEHELLQAKSGSNVLSNPHCHENGVVPDLYNDHIHSNTKAETAVSSNVHPPNTDLDLDYDKIGETDPSWTPLREDHLWQRSCLPGTYLQAISTYGENSLAPDLAHRIGETMVSESTVYDIIAPPSDTGATPAPLFLRSPGGDVWDNTSNVVGEWTIQEMPFPVPGGVHFG